MKYPPQKLNWFILDLLFMIFLLALFVESQAPLSEGEQTLVMVLMTIGFCALIAAWIWVNQYAIENLDRQNQPIRPYRIIVHQTPTPDSKGEDGVEEEILHDNAA